MQNDLIGLWHVEICRMADIAEERTPTVPYGIGYPSWFRQRIVEDRDKAEVVAKRFGVSVASVYRFRRLELENGSVARSPPAGGRRLRLSQAATEIVRMLTLLDPSARRDEIQAALRSTLDVDASASLITRTWARLGFTHKHLHRYYRNRDEDRRTNYWCNPPEGARGVAGISGVNTMSMIDIDEMGAELTECDRHWGHSPKGKAAIVPGRVQRARHSVCLTFSLCPHSHPK